MEIGDGLNRIEKAKKKPRDERGFFMNLLAEREGFEPSIGLTLRRISSAVHSTTLPPLQRRAFYNLALTNTRLFQIWKSLDIRTIG